MLGMDVSKIISSHIVHQPSDKACPFYWESSSQLGEAPSVWSAEFYGEEYRQKLFDYPKSMGQVVSVKRFTGIQVGKTLSLRPPHLYI
jgi:hypothetical protein